MSPVQQMTLRLSSRRFCWNAIGGILSILAVGSTQAASDWATVGGDLANTRFSTLSQINVSNVSKLGGAWVKNLGSPSRTPPVVVSGVMYINDSSSIYALNAQTGATIWEYKLEGTTPARGGVALGGGLIYCGLSDAHIIALEPKSGKLVWTGFIGNSTEQGDPGSQMNFPGPIPSFNPKVGLIVSAPTYVNGMIISGLSGGDGGVRSKVAALDAKTGRLAWTFWVIPSPRTPGAETWPKDGDALRRGGGAVWTQGAADAKLGLVYYGTGNPVPQLGGETRPGDNLYTASVIALNVRTGRLQWHYQLTHHDLWEMDVSTPLILYTAQVDGQPRDALAAARTDGYLFLLDRKTGRPIHSVEERHVPQDARLKTAATQPFPVGAERIGPTCVDEETAPRGFELGCWFDTVYSEKPNILLPVVNMRQAPMSYDPETGYFYAMAQATPVWFARTTEDPFTNIQMRPPESSEYGIYAAIDSRTEKIVWQKKSPWGLSGGSGALTTSGGLLFHMEGDGTIQADDARTGSTLWKFQTGSIPVFGPQALMGGVPAAAYEVAGVQYIAIVSNRALWSFSLGGSISPFPAPPSPPRTVGFNGLLRRLPDDGSGEIDIGTGNSSSFQSVRSAFAEEAGFTPDRAIAQAGIGIKWTNKGRKTHTIVAADRSWTTGPILPGQSVSISIEKRGTYVFWSEEAPWSKGQLTIR
jgi:quinohemoprotein ethanol dehydrogenase